jgi:hypothetical protein
MSDDIKVTAIMPPSRSARTRRSIDSKSATYRFTERDGGMIAVTLMSSDMGKLYAALAQAIDKRR